MPFDWLEIDLNTIDGGVILGTVLLVDVVEGVSRGLPAVRVHKAGDHHVNKRCTAVKFKLFNAYCSVIYKNGQLVKEEFKG